MVITLEETRYIWYKGLVMNAGIILTNIIINECNLKGNDKGENLYFRPTLIKDQLDRVETFVKDCLIILFGFQHIVIVTVFLYHLESKVNF